MEAYIERTGTIEGLANTLEAASTTPDTKGLLLLTCDGNGYDPHALDPLLERLRLPIVGGLFPALLAGQDILEQGSICMSLPMVPQVLRLGTEGANGIDVVRKTLLVSSVLPKPTMVILTDGLDLQASILLDAVFDVFGLEGTRYLGGGAGSLSLKRKPCLITNEGMTPGGALVIGLDLRCGTGSAHGHVRVDGPYQVTSASGPIVHSLNWRPAATYFREIIRHHLKPGQYDSTALVSKHFCLGLNRADGDFVVREPFAVLDDDSLRFAIQMEENELVELVMAERNSMLNAGATAREEARSRLGAPPRTNLCFTCCARRMVLGDEFLKEIRGLTRGGVPLLGAITVGGEIANNGECYLDYFNRTCVVGSFAV